MICKKCSNFTHDVELYCKICGADLDLYSDKAKKVTLLSTEEVEEKEIKEIFIEEKSEEPSTPTEDILSFEPKKLEEEEK